MDLDPLSPVIRTTIPEFYYLNGEFDRAIQEARQVIDAFPDFMLARTMLVMALMAKQDFAQVLEELDKCRAREGTESIEHSEMRGFALARLGRTAEAREILARFEKELQEGKRVEGYVGALYLGLREYDKALDYIEKAATHEKIDAYAKHDPFLQELKDQPRFQALLKKVSLEKEKNP